MSHCSDDDLVLHHYGEDGTASAHVGACAECAARYRELASILQAVTLEEPPARGDHYGIEVWQQIRHRLPERAAWWHDLMRWQWVAATAAGVLLIVAGFAAGRLWPDANPDPASAGVAAAADDEGRRRVLLLTVADHLDRSGRVLTDIVNAPGGADISAEQQWATDLVAASRLYRQDAIDTNERSVAAVLDELERTLLEIVHRPSHVTAGELEQIRRRIDSAALLFKVRVMSSELRQRELGPAPASSSPSTIG